MLVLLISFGFFTDSSDLGCRRWGAPQSKLNFAPTFIILPGHCMSVADRLKC
uniref:Uncharacterized protein n=1 Tax=Rhizophora mucronata TaxID=61149 RepID=A0A2P2K1N0_RHIMU